MTVAMEGERVLVYPFEYQDGAIDDDTLKKLAWDTKDDVDFLDAHESRQVAIHGVKGGVKVRRNFEKGVEIRQTDVERLQPGVWLNDTLVDFWCLWYVSSSCTPKYAVSENDRHTKDGSDNNEFHCAVLQGNTKRY